MNIKPEEVRRGLFLQYILFMVVFFPTIMLLNEHWDSWFLSQIVGPIILFVFLVFFPDLKKYKVHYLVSQIFGITLGLILWNFPAERLTLAYTWIVSAAIFCIKPMMGITRILSK